MIKEILLGFCGLAACSGATIQGTVRDWEGKPIADALVHIVDPFKAGDSLRSYTRTDEDGRFTIQMDSGKYQVLVSKLQSGYPDLQFSFFSAGGSIPEISLDGQTEVASVTVSLRKPFGQLSGHVSDSTTGLPIPGAQIKLAFEDARDTFIQFSAKPDGSFDTLVPNHNLTMVVSAPKYKPKTLSLAPTPSGKSREISAILSMDR